MVTGINYFQNYRSLGVDDSMLKDVLTDATAWSAVRSVILWPASPRESSVQDSSGDFAFWDG